MVVSQAVLVVAQCEELLVVKRDNVNARMPQESKAQNERNITKADDAEGFRLANSFLRSNGGENGPFNKPLQYCCITLRLHRPFKGSIERHETSCPSR